MNVKQQILSVIENEQPQQQGYFSTADLATRLCVKRNTVSHYLNQLVQEQKLIKVNTRPVIFVAKEVAEIKVGHQLNNEYASLEDLATAQKADVFANVIGHDQSLYSQIKKLKAAASYPGRLPVLINGQTGTGKSYIARKFFDYCVAEGNIAPSGKFVNFNCAEYADNPELLTSTLFGYAKGAFTGADMAHSGLFDEADGGMLFLDEVHRLDPKGQEKLFTYLDTGTISPLGEAAVKKRVNVRLVCATTEDTQSSFLETFIRRIPVQITMPALNERTASELRSLIIYFYIQHAQKIARNIKVNSQVFATLMNTKFTTNIGQLRNAVLLSVANALEDSPKQGEVNVKLANLPQDILLSSISTAKQSLTGSQSDMVIRPDSQMADYVVKHRSADYIQQAIQKIFTLYKQEDFASFKAKAFAKINTLCDYLIFKKEALDIGELPLDLIKQTLNQEVGYLQDDLRNDFNGNILVTIAYYFYFRQENQWQLSVSESQLADEIIKRMNEATSTVQVVQTIITVVSNRLNLYTDEIDYLFLTVYLSGAQRKQNADMVHCILLAHGYSTASSIADTVNKITGEPLLDSFDMPIDIQTQEIAQKVANYIHARHVTNGLILMADMGSLEQIPELLKVDLNFPVVIFNNVSTQLALFVADYIKQRRPLETIVDKMKQKIHNDYRIIYPKMTKQNAILVCCTTGVGTANKIKNMIEESLPPDKQILVMAYSYDWLKIEDQETAIKHKYNILAVIGTANPDYSSVPFISLDELVNGSKIGILEKSLTGILNYQELRHFNHLIIRNFTIERVINSLTILDTKAVMANIDRCIDKLNDLLGVELKNKTIMALYVHVSCMIERLIRNQPLTANPENWTENITINKQITSIKTCLHLLEQNYNITIPFNEIRYIYQLITNSEQAGVEEVTDEDF